MSPKVHVDTAGAAADVAAAGTVDQAAIASRLAAEIYGLDILRSDLEDAEHNTTRFVILAREAREPPPYEGPVITSFLFQVRNVPAALYKALGGFATNGVNMIKLESYVDARFSQAQFYAEVLGHPEQEGGEERVRGAGVLLARGRAPGRLPGRPVPLPRRLDLTVESFGAKAVQLPWLGLASAARGHVLLEARAGWRCRRPRRC